MKGGPNRWPVARPAIRHERMISQLHQTYRRCALVCGPIGAAWKTLGLTDKHLQTEKVRKVYRRARSRLKAIRRSARMHRLYAQLFKPDEQIP